MYEGRHVAEMKDLFLFPYYLEGRVFPQPSVLAYKWDPAGISEEGEERETGEWTDRARHTT